MSNKRNEFFAKKFSELVKKWKAEHKKSQEDLAEEIGCGRNSITNWKKGEDYPEQYMHRICEVFGVTEDYFLPETDNERYHYDSSYMTSFGGKLSNYSREIGLDIGFVQALHNMGKLDERFPIYRDIAIAPMSFALHDDKAIMDAFYHHYQRLPKSLLADSAPIEGEPSCFQIQLDGKRVTLGIQDLEFLLDIQKSVSEYIDFLFFKREREQEEEVERANMESIERLEDGSLKLSGRSSGQAMKYDKYIQRILEREEEENNG